MMADPQRAQKISAEKGIGNLSVYDLTPGDARQLEDLVEETESDIVIIDQIRNMNALNTAAKDITRRMDQAAQEFRAMLKRQDVLGISIAQAYAGEHGKKVVWYGPDDIDSSRVGLAASGDLVIGIGADENMLEQDRRALSIGKNKLGDTKKGIITHFDLRHSKVKAI